VGETAPISNCSQFQNLLTDFGENHSTYGRLGQRGRVTRKGASMSTTEAFLLGMMVSWTPSLLLLGWLLLREASEPNGVQH
jgi:hypothetical protein